MDRKQLAQQLQQNPLLKELLGAWRQDIIDDMLGEQDRERREALWHEQQYLLRLTERLDEELRELGG